MSSPVATTLKIAADLKRRVVAAAKAADQSPHAFMLDAIERQTRLTNSAVNSLPMPWLRVPRRSAAARVMRQPKFIATWQLASAAGERPGQKR